MMNSGLICPKCVVSPRGKDSSSSTVRLALFCTFFFSSQLSDLGLVLGLSNVYYIRAVVLIQFITPI